MQTQKTIFLFLSALCLFALNWVSCKKEEPTPYSSPYNYNYTISWQGYKVLLYEWSNDSTATSGYPNDTLIFISNNQFLYRDSTYTYCINGTHYGTSMTIPSLPPYGGIYGPTYGHRAVGDTLFYYAASSHHLYRLWMRRIE